MKEHKKTALKDTVSRKGKVAYGLGAIAENSMQNAVTNMANPFFNVALNVAPGLLGMAAMFFRVWDAITDPIMGWISDRTESRFGRRKPYIVVGAILGGLLFAGIWWCPLGMSPNFYLVWYLVLSLLFYSAFTVFGVPYVALGYELSTNYHERTRVMAYRTWFQSISIKGASQLAEHSPMVEQAAGVGTVNAIMRFAFSSLYFVEQSRPFSMGVPLVSCPI